MKQLFFAALLSFVFASCGSTKTDSTSNNKTDSTAVAAAEYQCPMDCEKGKTYDKPGQCPVCGMDLEKKG